jgi:hypothetical protein
MNNKLTYTLMVCRNEEPELYHFDNYALAVGVFKEWCDLLQIRKRDFVQGYFGEQIIWAEEDNKSVSLIPNII